MKLEENFTKLKMPNPYLKQDKWTLYCIWQGLIYTWKIFFFLIIQLIILFFIEFILVKNQIFVNNMMSFFIIISLLNSFFHSFWISSNKNKLDSFYVIINLSHRLVNINVAVLKNLIWHWKRNNLLSIKI